ncbi:MAG TPA: secretin N-terminal domain-containing protein [Candidatus Tectomicrobia bacterium]|jgi:type IV pilus assembly protein PilQ
MWRCLSVSLVIILLCTVLSPQPRLAAGAPAGGGYRGKKISLDLQNAELGDVFRLLAEASGLNILASPEVKGTITTRLLDVPWDQALDLILRLNGLTQERYGNVILLVPLARVSREHQERLQARHVGVPGESRVTRVIPINYANAAALKSILEQLLGACAGLAVDTRTNTLLVTGTPSCLRLPQLP